MTSSKRSHGEPGPPSARAEHVVPQTPCARIERDASLRRMKRSRLYAPPQPSIDEGGEAKTAAIFAAHHEFVRDDARDGASKRWETRMARRYYDELHKEYAI